MAGKWLTKAELVKKTGTQFCAFGNMFFCSECGRAVSRPMQECPYCQSKMKISLLSKAVSVRRRKQMLKEKKIADLLEEFPKGTRVELITMNDIQAPPPGTRGIVTCVDGMGTIHVRWDNGSSLGVVIDGGDRCRRIFHG